MMMFHNHPSGLCRPSREDMDITGKFKEAARTMDIRFLVHIIICYDTRFQGARGSNFPSCSVKLVKIR